MLPLPFQKLFLGGTPLILPTARSAQAMRERYDDERRAGGEASWEPANILSWQQWLNQMWSKAITSGVELRLLLNAVQEHALWLEAIAAKPATNSLTSADAIADLAAQAWALTNAYRCTSRLQQSADTHDSLAFAGWAEVLARDCERKQFLSVSALEDALTRHIQVKSIGVPRVINILGFVAFTPAQRALLDAVRNVGTEVVEQAFPTELTQRFRFIAKSPSDELRAVAFRIRDELVAHPTSRMAVLLPDKKELPSIDAVFRDVLAPELQAISADLSSAPWQCATDGPLLAQAMIACAVDVLELAHTVLTTRKLTSLFLSPYLGSDTDREAGARFDVDAMRQPLLLRPELDLKGVHRLAERAKIAPSWIKPLFERLSASNVSRPRSYADWAAFSRAHLKAAGWPGPRSLTSHEYQASEAFDGLLDTVSTLDFLGRRVSLDSFMRVLSRQAAATAFIPAPTSAPVQVLSPAAALAQSFDLLILMRATDTQYPARERLHPFLGFALQFTLDMPGADPRGATSHARAFYSKLLGSSHEVLLSSALETSEGPQRPSPMLTSIAEPTDIELALPEASSPLPTIASPDDLRLAPLPSMDVKGGARVLKLQAACGFLAFSELRLHSTQPNLLASGFDAMESGNIVHRALQQFWQVTKTQENLRNLTREDRRSRLRNAITSSLPERMVATDDWDKAYLALQIDRLLHLLDKWLEKELERSPFTVLASEQGEIISIGPLTLRIRVDRVDEVEGGHVLVDYKTGFSANPKTWEGDRLDEPQLPLYSVFAGQDQLKGVAFAHVRAGETMGWKGYQTETNILSAKGTRDLHADIEQWRHDLALLADDFAAGIADVNPKSFAINCRYCLQRLLCRINPEAMLPQPDADEDESTTREEG